jgi:hypothetical protein
MPEWISGGWPTADLPPRFGFLRMFVAYVLWYRRSRGPLVGGLGGVAEIARVRPASASGHRRVFQIQFRGDAHAGTAIILRRSAPLPPARRREFGLRPSVSPAAATRSGEGVSRRQRAARDRRPAVPPPPPSPMRRRADRLRHRRSARSAAGPIRTTLQMLAARHSCISISSINDAASNARFR